jgi:tetratricopeptide (TPR) repeat protein
MQSPDEKPQMCEFCKERPATERYTWATSKGPISEMMCARCYDVTVAHDALHRDTVFVDLVRQERYDEALARLDEILEANRHRDHEGRLVRSVALQRACILDEAGRYAEALQACEAWAELGIPYPRDRQLCRRIKALALHGLGRSREGLALLEDALASRDPKDPWIAQGDLVTLADISEESGQPVDPKWRSLAQELYGAEVPEHQPLGKAILALADAIREAEWARLGLGELSDDEDDEP